MINIPPVVVMVVMAVIIAAHIPPVPSVFSFRTEINKTCYVNISINVTSMSVRVKTVAVKKQ